MNLCDLKCQSVFRGMACRGCLECILKLLNFLLTLMGLAMVGYGIYLLVEYQRSSSEASSPVSDDTVLVQLGRPMLMAASLSTSILDNLPKAWYEHCPYDIGVDKFASMFGMILLVRLGTLH